MNASRDLPRLGAVLAIGAMALLPMAQLPAFYDSFLYLVFFWISLSTSWALLSGFAGYFSLGHVPRGKKDETEAAIKGAARVIKRRYVISRVHAQFMEPRGTLGYYDQGEDRLILYADVQYPHRVRNMPRRRLRP